MKLEYIQEHLARTGAVAVGLGMALACGYMVGDRDAKWPLIIVGAIAVMTFLLVAQRRVWMLIPMTWMLGGKISALPIPFTVAHLAILIAFGMYLALKALKVLRFKPKTGIVEVGMLIMLIYVAIAYVRNPVGVEAFGSDRVGGRPYVDIIIACLAFWVLARSKATVHESIILPFLGIVGYAFHASVNIVAERFPSTTAPLFNLYSGISAAERLDPMAPTIEYNGRLTYLSGLGGSMTGVATCFWRPFTLLNPLNFGRFILFMGGLVAVLISGFRSNLMGVFELFLLSSYVRRGWGEVFRAATLGGGAIALLVLLQGNVLELPLPAQRALSFLPGKWEYAAKSDAQGSTEWRILMWKAMLTEDNYIQNKWLGDGFGFTHHQLEIMMANALTGTNADQQENLMISGGVHSGPVSTIRYVGYVGLALFLVLLVLVARRALQLIRRAKGTPFFPLALVYGMSAFLFPFNFVFIFGAFETDLPNAIFTIGMLKMLENSLDAHLSEKSKSGPEVIQPPKFQYVRHSAPVGRMA